MGCFFQEMRMTDRRPTVKAKIKPKRQPEHDNPVTCPSCGHIADSADFDCGGASPACLWCNACNAHFHSVTGRLVPIDELLFT